MKNADADEFLELLRNVTNDEYRMIGILSIQTISEASMTPRIMFRNNDGTEDMFSKFSDAYDVISRRMRILPRYRKDKIKKILRYE